MNSPTAPVPVIPETAPFTVEQRAYLNGFLAGLFSRGTPATASSPNAGRSDKQLTPLAILYGSQTGNAERLAKRAAREAGQRGFAPAIHDLAEYPVAHLGFEQNLLVVTSTYGDGEPPDNARDFWTRLSDDNVPSLGHTRFSVLALGDSHYAKFCQFGRDVDARLEKLGASRIYPRMDCDLEFEEPFARWLNATLRALSDAKRPLTPDLSLTDVDGENHGQTLAASGGAEEFARRGLLAPSRLREANGENEGTTATPYSRSNPYPARLVTNRRLNGRGSAKDVRHFEIAIENSGLVYEVGDALGIVPTNDPELVEALLSALGCDGDAVVPGKSGQPTALRAELSNNCELGRIPTPLLQAMAARSGDAELKNLAAPDANGELAKFLFGRDVLDLLRAHPEVKFDPADFVKLLSKLHPRLYSIASSPKAHAGAVHLTVGVVRYEFLGRERQGICSTFLAGRAGPETRVPVFVHANPSFRPPAPDAPLIMVGPGTGIAPFRAFLQERRAIGATGRNWLFFGDQKCATDFLYREELEEFQREGQLTRLDVAWSRDQTEKVYVQHQMLERAREVFDWLEDGAGFYVCGDATRMARDVDAALHEIIQRAGGKTPEAAADYVSRLKATKRYRRDVY